VQRRRLRATNNTLYYYSARTPLVMIIIYCVHTLILFNILLLNALRYLLYAIIPRSVLLYRRRRFILYVTTRGELAVLLYCRIVSGGDKLAPTATPHRCNSAWCSRRQLLLFLIVIRETGRRIRTTGRRRPCVVDGPPLPTRASHTPTRSGRRFPRSSCVPYECRRYETCTSYYTL